MSQLKQKILSVIGQPQIISLATITPEGKPWVRYVMGMGDEDLSMRFVTSLKSRKALQIQANPEVHVCCGVRNPAEMGNDYVQFQGKAEISTDEALLQAMWNPHLKAYFSGPDDPDYCVGVIQPYRIEFMGRDAMDPEVLEL